MRRIFLASGWMAALLAIAMFAFPASARAADDPNPQNRGRRGSRGGQGNNNNGGGQNKGGQNNNNKNNSNNNGGQNNQGGGQNNAGNQPQGGGKVLAPPGVPKQGGAAGQILNKPNVGDGKKPNTGGGNKPNAGNGNKPNPGNANKPNNGDGNKPNAGGNGQHDNHKHHAQNKAPGKNGWNQWNKTGWNQNGWNNNWNSQHQNHRHGYWNNGIWIAPWVISRNLPWVYLQPVQPIVSGQKWLGVTFEPYDGGGAYVTGIYEGSPAQQVGIEVGDVIVSLDGIDATQLGSAVQASDGDVDLQVLSGRTGQLLESHVNLLR